VIESHGHRLSILVMAKVDAGHNVEFVSYEGVKEGYGIKLCGEVDIGMCFISI